MEGRVGVQLIVYKLDFIQPALNISGKKKKLELSVTINKSLKLVKWIKINSLFIGNIIKSSVTLLLKLNILIF